MKKYSRLSNGRIEYLEELLIYVFGKTGVNYRFDKEGVEYAIDVIEDTSNSIFKSCKFKTRQSLGTFRERFVELFEAALTSDKTIISGIKLGSDDFINNTQKYLSHIGVDFNEWDEVKIEKEKWRWIMNKAIVLYILPAIFFVEYKDRRNSDFKTDDIGLQMGNAVNQIQSMLNNELRDHIADNHAISVDEIGVPENALNYIFPVDPKIVTYPDVIIWEKSSMRFAVRGAEGAADDKCSQSRIKTQEKPLLEGFYKISPQGEMIRVKDPDPDRVKLIEISLSTREFDCRIAGKPKIKYRIRLSEDDLHRKYQTNDQLKNTIKKKAINSIENELKNKEREYYVSVAEYIKSVLDNIYSIEPWIFTGKDADISRYRDTLSRFTGKAGEVIYGLVSAYGEDETKKLVAHELLSVILEFSLQLSEKSEHLAGKYLRAMSDNELYEYKESIEKFAGKDLSSGLSGESSAAQPFKQLARAVQKYYRCISG